MGRGERLRSLKSKGLTSICMLFGLSFDIEEIQGNSGWFGKPFDNLCKQFSDDAGTAYTGFVPGREYGHAGRSHNQGQLKGEVCAAFGPFGGDRSGGQRFGTTSRRQKIRPPECALRRPGAIVMRFPR